MELKPGITGSSESFVTRSQTARSMDSRALEVFATPAMIAGMESLCLHTAEPYLMAEDISAAGLLNAILKDRA